MANVYWDQIIAILIKIVTYPGFKVLWAIIISVVSFVFGLSNFPAEFALFLLIIGDAITGMAAAYYEGSAIESRKAIKTVFKLLVYFGAIAAGHLLEVAGVVFLPIDETVTGWLAVTEFISIMENFGRMGYTMPNKLLNRLVEYKNAG